MKPEEQNNNQNTRPNYSEDEVDLLSKKALADISESDIAYLIGCEKVAPNIKSGFKEVKGSKRIIVQLTSTDEKLSFAVIIRFNKVFNEDFSVIFKWKSKASDEILIRCNSKAPHKNKFGKPRFLDDFHIHIATTEAISQGMRNEEFAKVTDKYADYKGAIKYLIDEINVMNKDRFDHLVNNDTTLFGDKNE